MHVLEQLELLAQASTDSRLDHAGWAPVRIARGRGESRLARGPDAEVAHAGRSGLGPARPGAKALAIPTEERRWGGGSPDDDAASDARAADEIDGPTSGRHASPPYLDA